MNISLGGIGSKDESHLIIGYTMMDHKLRTRLNLTALEYIVFDYYYHRIIINKDECLPEHIYRYTGITFTAYKILYGRLIKKNVITKDGQLSDKAKTLLNHDDIFEKIWLLFKKNPGTKKAGRKMFDRAIKKVPAYQLLEAATNYAEQKKDVEKMYFSHVSSFLNPDNEKYTLYMEKPEPIVVKSTKVLAEW